MRAQICKNANLEWQNAPETIAEWQRVSNVDRTTASESRLGDKLTSQGSFWDPLKALNWTNNLAGTDRRFGPHEALSREGSETSREKKT